MQVWMAWKLMMRRAKHTWTAGGGESMFEEGGEWPLLVLLKLDLLSRMLLMLDLLSPMLLLLFGAVLLLLMLFLLSFMLLPTWTALSSSTPELRKASTFEKGHVCSDWFTQYKYVYLQEQESTYSRFSTNKYAGVCNAPLSETDWSWFDRPLVCVHQNQIYPGSVPPWKRKSEDYSMISRSSNIEFRIHQNLVCSVHMGPWYVCQLPQWDQSTPCRVACVKNTS